MTCVCVRVCVCLCVDYGVQVCAVEMLLVPMGMVVVGEVSQTWVVCAGVCSMYAELVRGWLLVLGSAGWLVCVVALVRRLVVMESLVGENLSKSIAKFMPVKKAKSSLP